MNKQRLHFLNDHISRDAGYFQVTEPVISKARTPCFSTGCTFQGIAVRLELALLDVKINIALVNISVRRQTFGIFQDKRAACTSPYLNPRPPGQISPEIVNPGTVPERFHIDTGETLAFLAWFHVLFHKNSRRRRILDRILP